MLDWKDGPVVKMFAAQMWGLEFKSHMKDRHNSTCLPSQQSQQDGRQTEESLGAHRPLLTFTEQGKSWDSASNRVEDRLTLEDVFWCPHMHCIRALYSEIEGWGGCQRPSPSLERYPVHTQEWCKQIGPPQEPLSAWFLLTAVLTRRTHKSQKSNGMRRKLN